MMGGIPPAAAAKLTLWEYGAILYEWNIRHAKDTDPVAPPSEADVKAAFAGLARAGLIH